jgi:hypothetical protein
MAYFDTLTTTQVGALTTTQIAAITSEDLGSLTTTQIPVLTTTQIGVLTVTAIPGFTTTVIPYLETTDLKVFSTGQIAALESSDIGALTTTQVGILTTTQLGAIEFPDIAGLTTTQLAALTTTNIAVLSVDGIAELPLGYSSYQMSGRNTTLKVIPPNPIPVAIPAGVTWSSGLIQFDGFNAAVAAILANQILTVTVQRYMDSEGLLPVGAAGTLTSTANTAGYTSVLSVDVPATHLKVTVANGTTATAIVRKFAIGIQAN